MLLVKCGCGQEIELEPLPYRPFVKCPNCGRRLPVPHDPSVAERRCAKCGELLDEDTKDIHCAVCSGKYMLRF